MADGTEAGQVVVTLAAIDALTVLCLTVPERLVLHTAAHQAVGLLVHEDPAQRHLGREPVTHADLLARLLLAVVDLGPQLQQLGHAEALVEHHVVEVHHAGLLTLRVEVGRDAVTGPEDVGLEQDGEDEGKVEQEDDEQQEDGGRGGVGQTHVQVERVAEQVGRVEALEEDVQQVGDHALPAHHQLQAVLASEVVGRVAMLADHGEDPVEDVVEHVAEEGEQ